jgi:hypothetical protein
MNFEFQGPLQPPKQLFFESDSIGAAPTLAVNGACRVAALLVVGTYEISAPAS